jgi:hypothetical protein
MTDKPERVNFEVRHLIPFVRGANWFFRVQDDTALTLLSIRVTVQGGIHFKRGKPPLPPENVSNDEKGIVSYTVMFYVTLKYSQ